MSFDLKSVVPWGRNLKEYQLMFDLSEQDLSKKIISFGDGPASFNSQLTSQGRNCISVDPIYHFSVDQLKQRFEEVREEVLGQVKKNAQMFVWDSIQNIEELEELRTNAMIDFLEDFEKGKVDKRYIPHSLPDKTGYRSNEFDLGLSSHFLVLYESLGLDFHLESLNELLRICREVRIFPLLNLDAKKSLLLEPIITHLSETCRLEVRKVSYEFQKGGNEMLVIQKPVI